MTLSFEAGHGPAVMLLITYWRLKQEKLKQTSSLLIHYLFRTQKRSLDHLQTVETYQIEQFHENGLLFQTKLGADGNHPFKRQKRIVALAPG